MFNVDVGPQAEVTWKVITQRMTHVSSVWTVVTSNYQYIVHLYIFITRRRPAVENFHIFVPSETCTTIQMLTHVQW